MIELSGGLQERERPKRLYKYLPRPFFIENGLFRFSQPGVLNDPNEALPELSFARYATEDYQRARAKAERGGMAGISDDDLEAFFMDPYPAHRFDEKSFPGLWPATCAELRKEPFNSIEEFDRAVADRAVALCREKADRDIGIFSLTASISDAMWAYYAGDHTGVAVAFDTTHGFFWKEPHVLPVQYSTEPIYVSSRSGVVRIAGDRLNQDDILSGAIQELPKELFLRKRSEWRHEQEWRMIRSLNEADEIRERDGRYPIFLFEVPGEAILEICIGYKASTKMINHVKSAIAGNTKWHHVRLTQRVRRTDGKMEEQQLRV